MPKPLVIDVTEPASPNTRGGATVRKEEAEMRRAFAKAAHDADLGPALLHAPGANDGDEFRPNTKFTYIDRRGNPQETHIRLF